MTRHKLNQLRALRGRVRLTVEVGKSRERHHEAWLFKNKRALALVRRGLEDAKQGRLVERLIREAEYDIRKGRFVTHREFLAGKRTSRIR